MMSDTEDDFDQSFVISRDNTGARNSEDHNDCENIEIKSSDQKRLQAAEDNSRGKK